MKNRNTSSALSMVATHIVCVCCVTLLLAGSGAARADEMSKAGSKDAVAEQPRQWSFDADAAGQLPAGLQVFSGKWEVLNEADAPSQPNGLCQTGYADYPALVLDDRVYGDAAVSVRFRPVSGRIDQAAGIIFRIQDKDNYFILRANALEDNVNIYKHVKGWRRLIKEGFAKVPSGTWQELRVEVKGNAIRGLLNGQLVVEANDDTFTTGKVGLWTKADSVTCFDNVKITPIMLIR